MLCVRAARVRPTSEPKKSAVANSRVLVHARERSTAFSPLGVKMPALIVNFDEVLFRTGGASPRPDAIRLIKDADASGWQIALTSELTQDTVRERLAPFLPDLAASALVAGREYAVEGAPNTIDV